MRIGLGVRWAPVLSLGGVGMGALLVRSGFGYWVSWIMCHHGRLPPPICQFLPHNRPCTTTTSAPCARTSPIMGAMVIDTDTPEVNLLPDDAGPSFEALPIINFIESNALLVRMRSFPKPSCCRNPHALLVRMRPYLLSLLVRMGPLFPEPSW